MRTHKLYSTGPGLRILLCLFVFICIEYCLTAQVLFDNSLIKPSYAETNCEPMEMRAVYPGSFDPMTNGHIDIIHRGLKIFDNVVVAVLENPKKKPFFSTKERVDMISEIFRPQKKLSVMAFRGLLVDFARQNHAQVVMRGLRAISDFEYEFQMALMNRKLDPEIEIFFMMPSVDYSFLSSNMVKEVCMLGGCLKGLVHPLIEKRLKAKFRANPDLSLV